MSFSDEQVVLLKEPVLKEDVKTREGTGKTQLSYLASFHVIAEANRIFGFDAWDSEILSLSQVDKTEYEKPPYKAGDDPKQMISISYLCKLRVTVKAGENQVIREDVGFGNGVAGNTAYGIGSCIELASKEAVTDALKRCMRYFGDKFGLTLYDKDNTYFLDSEQFEESKPVTNEQLSDLRELYEERGIDDEWVLTAIKAENYSGDSLEDMRQDWYRMAFDIAHKYKLAEIEKANLESDINKVIKLMKESANENMLKALFKEAWEKTKKFDDKEKQVECQKVYESMKKELSK
mgnify:CR=1 FL=1